MNGLPAGYLPDRLDSARTIATAAAAVRLVLVALFVLLVRFVIVLVAAISARLIRRACALLLQALGFAQRLTLHTCLFALLFARFDVALTRRRFLVSCRLALLLLLARLVDLLLALGRLLRRLSCSGFLVAVLTLLLLPDFVELALALGSLQLACRFALLLLLARRVDLLLPLDTLLLAHHFALLLLLLARIDLALALTALLLSRLLGRLAAAGRFALLVLTLAHVDLALPLDALLLRGLALACGIALFLLLLLAHVELTRRPFAPCRRRCVLRIRIRLAQFSLRGAFVASAWVAATPAGVDGAVEYRTIPRRLARWRCIDDV